MRASAWNAASLFHGNPRARKARWKLFERLLGSSDVVMLQEVHGDEHDLYLNFSRWAREFTILAQKGKDFATAGVAILIRRARFGGF